MDYQKIVSTVEEFMVDEFEIEKEVIKPESDLIKTVDLDSLDFVDLVVIIESKFGLKVTAEDFKSISTFKDFYEFIDLKINS